MVESTGLENRHTLIAYLGFKSLSLRHIQKKPAKQLVGFFVSEGLKRDLDKSLLECKPSTHATFRKLVEKSTGFRRFSAWKITGFLNP
ncbi:hypothetical protein THF1C08_250078 [Vibrio jasicida]|uniref:Transposase n=1 Tax=Vibrio jasicida TaxID=766224 RepID=A0AAU9QM17_9VIBR|nr:hypothetical protein THF1C08_250078 [Vibrio jasicida]CAH1592572.1 hypothetical protein THF1A12_250079 [Vibrio jasicida]